MKSNRLFSARFAALVALLVVSFAGQAWSVVTINHASTTLVNPLAVGDQFTVTVRLTWDGQGSLQGVFSSTTFDANVIEYVSNTNFPASILGFVDPDTQDIIPGLSRLGGLNQPGDPASILRTVQYGGTSAADSRALTTGAGRLITTYTFRAKAAGTTSIETVIANGDNGAVGDSFTAGTAVAVTVPEPGQVLLGMMALGTVAGVVAVRRRI